MRMALSVRGDRVTGQMLEKMGKRATNLTPVLTEAGEIMQHGIEHQWESDGAFLGGKGSPWEPLSQLTEERKAAQGFDPEPLVATGKLGRSLLKGGSGHIFKITPVSVRVGTRDYVALFHQGGSAAPSSGRASHKAGAGAGGDRYIPARKVVGVRKKDWGIIYALLRKHLVPKK
jgi:hypothetical protein